MIHVIIHTVEIFFLLGLVSLAGRLQRELTELRAKHVDLWGNAQAAFAAQNHLEHRVAMLERSAQQPGHVPPTTYN